MKYALVIGCSEYEDGKLSKLRSPGADTQAFAAVLRDQAIGEFDEVIEIDDDKPLDQVREEIDVFFSKKKPEDVVLFYFSGHGVLDSRSKLHFAIKKTRTDQLRSTAIPASYVVECMDDCRSKRQVIILDCCQSGAFMRGAKGDIKAITEETFKSQGYGCFVLTATDAVQVAFDGDRIDDQSELSLFTHHLLEGLKTGEADQDGDGQVSLDEWYQYTYDKVLNETNRQTPNRFIPKQAGNLIIAKNPNKKTAKVTELPPELRQALGSSLIGIRSGAVEELGRLLYGDNSELAGIAKSKLEELKKDDSITVKNAAKRVLKKFYSPNQIAVIPINKRMGDSGPGKIEFGLKSKETVDETLLPTTGQDPREKLLDFQWIYDQLKIVGPDAVISEYDSFKDQEPFQLIQQTLRFSAHILRMDSDQLSAQLIGRLSGISKKSLERLMEGAKNWRGRMWLRPGTECMSAPGGTLLHSLDGHTSAVRDVAITPDGRRAVSASEDHTLKVWDLESGKELHSLEGHSYHVLGVAISPDGRRAVSASKDKTLKVWDLESGKELHTLIGHTEPILNVAITPDGRRAVSASGDKTLKVWDLESGKELHSLIGHTESIRSVAITPDGRRAVSASGDKTLKIWDLESGKELHSLIGHTERIWSVVITPNGRRALSVSEDKTLKVWNLENGKELHTLTYVCGVAITPDGWRAITAYSDTGDKILKVWDLESGKELRSLIGYSGSVYLMAITPDGQRVVSASEDKTLKVWDLGSGKELRSLTGHSDTVHSIAITPDGRRAVSASGDKTIKVWNLESGKDHRSPIRHSGYVGDLAITPDGRRAVSASGDKTLKVWDLETDKELHSLTGHSDGVRSVAVSPDGRWAVSTSGDKTLKVWDIESGKELRSLIGHSGYVGSVRITPDGRRAVSMSGDGTLKVLDLESGTELHSLDVNLNFNHGVVKGVAITSDGRRVVTATGWKWSKSLKVWDLESGKELRNLAGRTGHLDGGLAILPDGQRIVSVSSDHTLDVRDLESGNELRSLFGHSDAVRSVAIMPDGRRAVSASFDHTLKVWDLEKGELLTTFMGDNPFSSCIVSPDNKKIVAGDAIGTIYFLDIIDV